MGGNLNQAVCSASGSIHNPVSFVFKEFFEVCSQWTLNKHPKTVILPTFKMHKGHEMERDKAAKGLWWDCSQKEGTYVKFCSSCGGSNIHLQPPMWIFFLPANWLFYSGGKGYLLHLRPEGGQSKSNYARVMGTGREAAQGSQWPNG